MGCRTAMDSYNNNSSFRIRTINIAVYTIVDGRYFSRAIRIVLVFRRTSNRQDIWVISGLDSKQCYSRIRITK